MERGELGPDRVSRRLLDALGTLLGLGGRSLAELGGPVPGAPRAAAAGGTLFRAQEDAGDPLATTSRFSPARPWRPRRRPWTSLIASSSAGPTPSLDSPMGPGCVRRPR